MTKVNINGHAHQVEVDADEPLTDVVAAAQALWERTRDPNHNNDALRAGGTLHHQQINRGIGYAWRMGDGQQPHITAQEADRG
jgi:hypothetical protein